MLRFTKPYGALPRALLFSATLTGVYLMPVGGYFFASMSAIVPAALAAGTAAVSSPFLYNFDYSGTLFESGSMGISTSPYWWVDSGAALRIGAGRGSTIQGSLPASDYWRVRYGADNPYDTDNGYHPQNIFRLVTRAKWQNARQEVYFIITKDNLSASSNRNASNGLLLFNRYQNEDNLYYTGIRVDGSAVIKKKQYGNYYTLTQPMGIYPGTYNRASKPNLLPKQTWIGLRSEVVNLGNGDVRIDVYLDKGWSGVWKRIASAIDTGLHGPPITAAGFGGIRTDFMDVRFENFRFTKL